MGNYFDEIKEGVEKLTAEWKAKYAEENPSGLVATLLFVFTFLFSAVDDIIKLVEESNTLLNAPSEVKQDIAIEGFQTAYREVNPDLPWIPEPFETKLENWILDSALPAFIKWAVGKYNENGTFTHHKGVDAAAEPVEGPELDEE